MPALQRTDLRPRRAGMRAQAVDRSGKLLQGSLLLESTRSLHVCNVPSPAATSALPIARISWARIAVRIGAVGAAVDALATKTT